jgi:hypothetical protein
VERQTKEAKEITKKRMAKQAETAKTIVPGERSRRKPRT